MTCQPTPSPPVQRGLVFSSGFLEIRDNACNRHDTELSRETAPMPYDEIVFGRVGLWCRHHGRRTLPVDARHVHFFARGESHRVSHPAGCGDRNTGLTVEANALAAIAEDTGAATPTSPFATRHLPIDGRTMAAHRLLLASARHASRQAIEPLAIEELALRLLRRVLGAGATPVAPPLLKKQQRDLVDRARAALHNDLATPLSLGDVATDVGCSPFYLARTFSSATGSSLMKYRSHLRVALATGMILDTQLALADIAAATGFADRSHLTRTLRRVLGLPPTTLRQAAMTEVARRLLDH